MNLLHGRSFLHITRALILKLDTNVHFTNSVSSILGLTFIFELRLLLLSRARFCYALLVILPKKRKENMFYFAIGFIFKKICIDKLIKI